MKSKNRDITKIWKVPKTYVTRKGSASLLELFFDLIVVLVLGALTNSIEKTLTSANNDKFWEISFDLCQILTILFFWRLTMLDSTRFEKDNIRHRLFIMFEMIGFMFVVVGAYADDNVMNINSLNIKFEIIGYTIASTTIFINTIVHCINSSDKYIKKELFIESIGRTMTLILFLCWAVPMLVIDNENAQLAWKISISFWILNLFCFIFFGYLSHKQSIEVNTPDIPLGLVQERFSILYIIFLGESLLSSVTSVAEKVKHQEYSAIGYTIALFIWIYSIWWVYRDIFNYTDIVARPRKIVNYSFAMCLTLFSFVFINAGIKLSIDHPDLKTGGLLIGSGAFIWNFMGVLVWNSLQDYKKASKILFPKAIRTFIYLGPIIFWTYGWAFIVFPKYYIWVQIAASILYVLGNIGMTIYLNLNLSIRESEFNKGIIIYESKDEEWINKKIIPLIDFEKHKIHQKTKGKPLNRYSKYC